MGLSCPGYRDEWDTRFRIETTHSYPSAVGRDRRRRQQQPLSSQYYYCFSLLRQHSPSGLYTDYVVPLVLYHFPSDTADEESGIISTLISAAKEGSPLHNVSKTLGCSYLPRASSSDTTSASQAQAYGDSLAAINRALRHSNESTSDGTLLSVWLLRVYEVRRIQ